MKRNLFIHLIYLLLVICLGITPLAGQNSDGDNKGEIGDFEKEVEGKNDEKDDDDDSGPFFLWLMFDDGGLELFFHALVGPVFAADSVSYVDWLNQNHFSEYPYLNSGEGLYSSATRKNFMIFFSGHYFYSSDHLNGMGIRAHANPLPYLGFEFQFTEIQEKLTRGFDHIRFYHVFANYHRVRSSRWTFWWGLGAEFMDGNRFYGGPAFNLGTEVFPLRPFGLFFSYKIGALNERAVSELRLQLNIYYKRLQFFTGYQRFAVGNTNLDGLTTGIGIHF